MILPSSSSTSLNKKKSKILGTRMQSEPEVTWTTAHQHREPTYYFSTTKIAGRKESRFKTTSTQLTFHCLTPNNILALFLKSLDVFFSKREQNIFLSNLEDTY